MKYIIFFLSLIFIFSCSKNSDPISTIDEVSNFGIYFLKDTLITERQTAQMDINSLDLKTEPWLTNNDIEFYDFSSHSIYLKKDKSYFFENYDSNFCQFTPRLISRPFVFIAGNKRCYVGAFHSGLLSMAPAGPYMDELDVCYFPSDVMHISRAWSGDEDLRSSPKLKEALIALDLYHGGLEIELVSFKIVNNSDTSIVDYSFKITNNDQDNLYVIDPLKMSSELFHYYTNGPHLWNYSKSLYIYSEYKKTVPPEPHDSWDVDWFTLIRSKQQIERTVRLKGYPYIPEGNYISYLNFANPKKIQKENRYLSNGRIWIGSIKSNDLEIIIQD
jgi:hypothetical protein